ncbi:MAG: hypothetical protein V4591_03065 [Bdellovibrionota bacterium]
MTRYVEIKVFNIQYIKVLVPVKNSPHGEFVDCDYKKVEEEVLRTIIKGNYPITGLEVKFIRHFLGMNMKNFGDIFCVTNAAICKWEKKKTPLELPNQIAIRAFVCEKLNIQTTFTDLSRMCIVKDDVTLDLKNAA